MAFMAGQHRQLEIEISSKKKIRSVVLKKRSTCYLPQGHKVGLKALIEFEKDLVVPSPQPHLNPLIFATRSSRLAAGQGNFFF
jgi:hypothetical protein